MLDRELFSQSVVHIAAHKWQGFAQYKYLTDKVRIVLDKHLKCAKRSDEIPYKQSPFTKGGIEAIFKDHGDALKRIYHFYSRSEKDKDDKKNKAKGKKANKDETQTQSQELNGDSSNVLLLHQPLPISQFRAMIKHAGLAEVTYSNQITFLESVCDQITGIMNEHIAPNATEIVYEEFLEMLAIMCLLRNPDPYTILNEKLGSFLEQNVIKPIFGTVMNKK